MSLIPSFLLVEDIQISKTKVTYTGDTTEMSIGDFKARAEVYKEQKYEISGDMQECQYVFYIAGDVDVKGDYFLTFNGEKRVVIKVDKHFFGKNNVDHTKVYTK